MKKQLNEILSEQGHNDSVWKKVLIRSGETSENVATYNYAWLEKGMKVEPHKHPDGLEYYLFISGKGEMLICEEWFPVGEGDFVIVPKDALHSVNNPHPEKFIFITLRTIIDS